MNKQRNKEKKLEKKLIDMKMDAGWLNVKKANNQSCPLDQLPSFKKYNRNDLSVSFETLRAPDLDEKTKDWVFTLIKGNMKDMYQKSDWGWNEKNKKVELFEDNAWYLIARDDDSVPVAFSHFRYDMDFDEDVLYCYEIQLEPSFRRKGLGKLMMKILELLMLKAEMVKIMLTVFKHNPDACLFFKNCLKYSVDETSPYNTIHEQFDYEILSRYNPKRKPSEDVENIHQQN